MSDTVERRGWVKFKDYEIAGDNNVRPILKGCKVLQKHYNVFDFTVNFLCIHESFDVVTEGEMPPEYTYNQSATGDVIFTRKIIVQYLNQ